MRSGNARCEDAKRRHRRAEQRNWQYGEHARRASMKLLLTLRGSDIKRVLRVILAILRHVKAMGHIFAHIASSAVNV